MTVALLVRGNRHAPGALGGGDVRVMSVDPFLPVGISPALAAEDTEGWLPVDVIGKDRVIRRQPVLLDDLLERFQALATASSRGWSLSSSGNPRPQAQVDHQMMVPAAAEQIRQVLRRERIAMDEHADGIEAELLDPRQIAFDDLRVIGLGAQPEFKHAAIIQCHARRWHVVHAVDSPDPAILVEVAIGPDRHPVRSSGRFPDGNRVLQPVDDLSASRSTLS